MSVFDIFLQHYSSIACDILPCSEHNAKELFFFLVKLSHVQRNAARIIAENVTKNIERFFHWWWPDHLPAARLWLTTYHINRNVPSKYLKYWGQCP